MARWTTTVLAVLLLLGACSDDGVPSRAPDVTGEIGRTGGAATTLVDASEVYFEGMMLSGEVVIEREDGRTRTDVTQLPAGTEVEVWVGEACGESYPVQCEIVAMRSAG